jgi:hypothetical protein
MLRYCQTEFSHIHSYYHQVRSLVDCYPRRKNREVVMFWRCLCVRPSVGPSFVSVLGLESEWLDFNETSLSRGDENIVEVTGFDH